jgi:hypothetical protein
MSLYDALCSKTLEVDMAAARFHPSPFNGPAICMRLITSFSITMLGEIKKRPFLASECDSLQGKNSSSNECKYHPLKELCLSYKLLLCAVYSYFRLWLLHFELHCTYLTLINAFYAYKNVSLEGEKWRRELVREITKKIAAIQNGK